MADYSENDRGPLGLRGVEVMTSFIDDPQGNALVFDLFERVAEEEGATGLFRTGAGLWHVSAWLLVRLAKETGTPEREILQQMARELATSE
jgi:hypothetical protein